MNKHNSPRILLVEDNPISREFLYEALLPLAIQVDVAATLAAACLLARETTHDLFLCDAHLLDGNANSIFQSLKNLQNTTEMVAITADTSVNIKETLLTIGYLEVWDKPITMAALQNNVERLLGIGTNTKVQEVEALLWDEASALRAVGNNEKTLKALRKMFLAELPKDIRAIEQAGLVNEHQKVKAECHKLLAGCGFVGAGQLAQAVKRLSEHPHKPELMNKLKQSAEECLATI